MNAHQFPTGAPAVWLGKLCGLNGQPSAERGPAAWVVEGNVRGSILLAAAQKTSSSKKRQDIALITLGAFTSRDRLEAAAGFHGEFADPYEAAYGFLDLPVYDATGLQPGAVGALVRLCMKNMGKAGMVVVWPVNRMFPEGWGSQNVADYLSEAAFGFRSVLPPVSVRLRAARQAVS